MHQSAGLRKRSRVCVPAQWITANAQRQAVHCDAEQSNFPDWDGCHSSPHGKLCAKFMQAGSKLVSLAETAVQSYQHWAALRKPLRNH